MCHVSQRGLLGPRVTAEFTEPLLRKGMAWRRVPASVTAVRCWGFSAAWGPQFAVPVASACAGCRWSRWSAVPHPDRPVARSPRGPQPPWPGTGRAGFPSCPRAVKGARLEVVADRGRASRP